MDTATVKKYAFEAGADLVGIASRERFINLEASENPLFIMPHLKSAIVLGFRVLRGGLRGVETGSTWNSLGNGMPFSVMVEETYNFCRILESAGWECTPLVRQSPDLRHQGVAVAPDKPEPDIIVDMDYMAYAAGLGSMGKAKLFLTPEFGPRQVFVAVLTPLELDADPLQATESVFCQDCTSCIDACPAKAIGAESTASVTTPCGTIHWNPLHIESCRICRTGTMVNNYSTAGDPNRLGAACGRACVACLEAKPGRLSKGLNRPFRQEGVTC